MNKEKIELLKELQEQQFELSNNLKEQKQALLDKFEEEWKDRLERNSAMLQRIEEIKFELTNDAQQEYKETGNKKLLGGIGIRVTKSYEYDKTDAFNWAKEHNLCLSLDDKAFKSLAKTQEFNFVKILENETVTFPKEIKLD